MSSAYTPREEKVLEEMYTANPCLETVDRISIELNKPRKSIISKLVKMGLYITRGYRTKTGEIPVTKLQIVRAIEDTLDIKLPDLDKTPKTTLKTLSEAIQEQTSLLEDALEEIKNLYEINDIREEMKRKRRTPLEILDPTTTTMEGRS